MSQQDLKLTSKRSLHNPLKYNLPGEQYQFPTNYCTSHARRDEARRSWTSTNLLCNLSARGMAQERASTQDMVHAYSHTNFSDPSVAL